MPKAPSGFADHLVRTRFLLSNWRATFGVRAILPRYPTLLLPFPFTEDPNDKDACLPHHTGGVFFCWQPRLFKDPDFVGSLPRGL
jgi:hypothetical protein